MLRYFLRASSLPYRRAVTTQAFVTSIEKLQQQLQTAPERRPELLRHGRHLFDVEILEDLPQAYSAAVAGKLCHVAAQLRISSIKGQPYAAMVEATTTDAAVASMDVASLARVLHSCLVLRSTSLYDVLFMYIRPLIARAGEANAIPIAVLLNTYGRAGVRHPELYQILCDTATRVMKDARLSMAHIANVAHALACVHYHHRPLMLVLREHALRAVEDVPPIIAVTLLDAFARLQFVDDEIFNAYEQHLLARVDALQPPLMAVLLSCLVLAGRATSATLGTLGERVVALAPTFDSASLARVCDAYYRANVLAEDVFGALAERACKVAADFRADEVYLVLNALSAFDLFDAELFPLLASRVVNISKQGGYVGPADAAGILASFAAVQERHEELIYFCTQVLHAYRGAAMEPAAYVNALWSCATLNIRNEAQMALVDTVRHNPKLLQLPSEADAASTSTNQRTLAVLRERCQQVEQIYTITIPHR